uniref:Very-long-chain (3R)-3-hydroxyacyl-CoA dehydratase n=1 Tax=Photinus pyralis TaxID=7054 RepID=A0A1Y1L455_PHOPY
MPHLNPFVYWAQNEDSLFLKIDLKDVNNPDIKFEERKFHFQAHGVGAHGCANYGFCLDFCSEINPNESVCKVLGSKIDCNIVKAKKGWWPRLTGKPQKPGWLKIDFDRWQSEDDLNSEDEKLHDIRDDYADLYERLKKEEFGYTKEDLKKVYFIIYNLAMFVGFTYVVAVLAVQYLKDGIDSFSQFYEVVGPAMKYLHFLQFSEIILVLIGWRSGAILPALIQIGGRLILINLLIDPEPRLHKEGTLFLLYLVWSSVELIRYPFYITEVCNIKVPLLKWLRYSAWIVLYPIGITLEAIVLYMSIPYLEETKRLSVSLPNAYNFSFSMVVLIRVYLLICMFPLSVFLMGHMYRARIKKLSSKAWKKIK